VDYLVDSNVLSEPIHATPARSVIDWLTRHEFSAVVTPIILGELEFGILRLPAGKRRTRLTEWFAAGPRNMRILDVDRETARIWATLTATLAAKGRTMPTADGLIAASALQHGLTLATRNIRDYRYAGVRLVNPFADR